MGKSIGAVVSRITGLVAAFVCVNSVIGAFNNAMANVTALDHLSQVTGVGIRASERAAQRGDCHRRGLRDGGSCIRAVRRTHERGARVVYVEWLSGVASALSIDVRDAQATFASSTTCCLRWQSASRSSPTARNKAALAAALFGEEAGPKMLVLLNKGKAGLEEIRRTLGSTYHQRGRRARARVHGGYGETAGRVRKSIVIAHGALARKFRALAQFRHVNDSTR